MTHAAGTDDGRGRSPIRRRRWTIAGNAIVLVAIVAGAVVWQSGRDTDTPNERPADQLPLELRVLDARSLDGRGNHDDASVGAAGQAYVRALPARYADGHAEPVDHPDERRISNRIFDDLGRNIHSARGITHWGYAWGQFVLHDIARTRPGDEQAPLQFSADDPLERFTNDLGEIPFTRSAAGPDDADGARTQINELSSYLDGSAVYGTTPATLDWLRAGPLDGDPTNNSAYLINDELLLPTAADRPGAPAPTMEMTGRLRADPAPAFIAGDVRANENWPLTSLHTMWVREHNRIVAALPDDLLEEARFQIARRVVIAKIQHITYNEYLPAMGVELPDYGGFDPDVDPRVADEFSTAAFRMHSQVHGELRLTDTYGGLSPDAVAALASEGITPQRGPEGTEAFVPLDVAFSNPALLQAVGIDSILQALSWDVGYANDETIDDALRSVLFQIPAPRSDPTACHGATVSPTCFRGVIDLAAIDVARGYDHGLPTYNDLREAYGLPRVGSFTELTGESSEELPDDASIDDPAIMTITASFDRNGDPVDDVPERSSAIARIERSTTTAARLRALYGNIDALDAFTGMQVERRSGHLKDGASELGELQQAIWTRQFAAIRDGDRWFSEGDPVLDAIAAEYGIDYRTTLDQVVRDNARTLREVPPKLFGR